VTGVKSCEFAAGNLCGWILVPRRNRRQLFLRATSGQCPGILIWRRFRSAGGPALEVALHYATQGHPTSKGSTWKAKARGQIVEIDPRRRYTPSDVAAILNCSYDTAIRRMRRMPGVITLQRKRGALGVGRRCSAFSAAICNLILTTAGSPDFVRILYTGLRNLRILRASKPLISYSNLRVLKDLPKLRF
jgi:hypothetical protein